MKRFSRSKPCPICGGWDNAPRGRGKRCFGFLSDDGRWAHCTREELAGSLKMNTKSSTYAHPLHGVCKCGKRHHGGALCFGSVEPTRRKIIATYDYKDAKGVLLFQVVRRQPKGFSQRRPDGSGGWIWNLRGVKTVLYRLPELLSADPAQPVFVPEGEKDANNLARLDVVCTTNPMGAGKWRGEYSEALRGRKVVLLPDNDPKGKEHMQAVARSLRGVARSVKIVELPNLPENGDVSDWSLAGGTLEALHKLVAEACEHEVAEDHSRRSISPTLDAIVPEPEESNSPAKVTQLDGPDGLHLTPMGNAERFLRDYSSDVLWVEGSTLNSSGSFYVWDGQRWQSNNVRAMLLARETVSNLKSLVAQEIAAGGNSDTAKSLVKFWRSCENDHQVREILSLAGWDVVIKAGQFDSDPDLFGVRNGVVDLRTGTLRTARREDHITKQANVFFDPLATCPLWEKFLLETTDYDHGFIAYLAQCVGISLTGHTNEHLLLVIIGVAGTGKTTFCEAIKYVLGDYCIGIDPNSLAASMKPEGGRARPDIARLPGVRLAFANETRQGLQLDAGLVKALTGGDTVQARHLYAAEFDFKPTHKLWLRTNYEPLFDGSDTGMQRRVRKLPFKNLVQVEDHALPEKLRGEAAGILNWAIRGLMIYQEHGLIEPAIVRSSTAEYVKSLDVLSQFIEERCLTGPFIQPSGELYDCYRKWVDSRGQKAVGQPRFNSDLEAKGFRRDKDRSGNKQWYGLRLTGVQADAGGKNQTSL